MCALMSFFIISPPCSIYHRKPIVSTILSTFPRQKSIKCLDSLEIVDYNVPSLENVDNEKNNLSFEEKGGNGMSSIFEVRVFYGEESDAAAELIPEEKEVIELWRGLNEVGKSAVLSVMKNPDFQKDISKSHALTVFPLLPIFSPTS